jgi:hypothetical protein
MGSTMPPPCVLRPQIATLSMLGSACPVSFRDSARILLGTADAQGSRRRDGAALSEERRIPKTGALDNTMILVLS